MTTTLPTIQNIQVATVPLASFLARQASILAAAGTSTPLPEINFLNATVLVGDGNVSGSPQCPSISTLQSTAALTHQVWSGKIVQSASQNSSNAGQIDLLCVIPAVDASGNEIGPFWVTEFIVTDENGTPMIAGVTAAPKFTVANGAITDLSFIVSVAFAIGTVVLTAPAEPFVSKTSLQSALANIVSGAAPITVTKSVAASGWTDFAVGAALAAMPADPIAAHSDLPSLGVGRPATAAEIAVGAPAAGAGFGNPWPTIQQVIGLVNGLIAGFAMTQSPTSNAFFIKFSNGFVLQGGSEQLTPPENSSATSIAKAISFPLAFASVLCGGLASAMGPSNATNGNLPAAGMGTTSLTGCVLTVDNDTGGSASPYPINESLWVSWIAFGK